jgi:hypothetical protein
MSELTHAEALAWLVIWTAVLAFLLRREIAEEWRTRRRR